MAMIDPSYDDPEAVMADDESSEGIGPDGYANDVPEELEGVDRTLIIDLARASGDISDMIPEDIMTGLGALCVQDWERDDSARSEWKSQTEKAMASAAQDPPEEKTYPFDGAANVQYPLLTVAAQQFAARAYPALVKGSEAVNVAVIGADPTGQKASRADRVKTYLNYQIFYRIEDWEGDTDVLLNQLPISGCGFRKVYYDPVKKRPCSEFVNALHLTVPSDATSLKTAPRITQDFEAFPYEIKERQRAGVYREVDLREGEDRQQPRQLIEQHRLHDMDDDGIDEPYIVTVDVESKEVLRIEAAFEEADVETNDFGEIIRITRWCPFVKYPFLPDPKGRFYDIGFGHLLGPISEVINTIINLQLDAGHAQVAGGGFLAAGLRLQGSGQTNVLRFSPSEYKVVNAPGGNIQQAIYERNIPGPSPVLFELLGLLMDAAKDISSVKDVLTGDAKPNQTATATLALIEQGLQTFTAIYKRIYRAAKQEFKLLYDCVARYGDPAEYARVIDEQGAQLAQDFNEQDMDIQPCADPAAVTSMQKMAKAQFLMQFLGKGLVDKEILSRVFEAAGETDIEKLFPPDQPQQPPQPNPQEQADIAETQSKTVKNRADAIKTLHEVAGGQVGAGGFGSMEGASGNGMGVGGPPQNGGPAEAGVGGPLMVGGQ